MTAGIDAEAVGRLAGFIQGEIDADHSGAAQFAIGVAGRIEAAQTFGAATNDTRFAMFSATKTVVAMALLPHLADGSLELTAPVSRTIPEFGENGKQDVSVLQLLTMQGGFPQAVLAPSAWESSQDRRSAFAEWTLDWQAGSRTEYHPIAAHWVIAELIETLAGRPFLDVVHDRVVAPSGAAHLLGGDPIDPVTVRLRNDPEDGTDPSTAALVEVFGRDDLVPEASIGFEALLSINHPRARSAGIPGGGGFARATDVALVYQGFLADDSPWARDAIGTVRNASINANDGVAANRTIAGCIAGADGYHAHRWAPPLQHAFGHNGAGGQLCWVDPDSGVSFVFLHDTLDQDPRRDFLRSQAINALAAACIAP